MLLLQRAPCNETINKISCTNLSVYMELQVVIFVKHHYRYILCPDLSMLIIMNKASLLLISQR